MARVRSYGPAMMLLASVLAVLLLGPTLVNNVVRAQSQAEITRVQNSLQQNVTLAELSDSFKRVANVVEPSVVHVEILGQRRQAGASGGRGMTPAPEDLLRRFFGDRMPDGFEQQPQPEGAPGPGAADDDADSFDRYNPKVPRGNGSGWVYDDDGHIITNSHVVADADEIRVLFFDGTRKQAKVVATDSGTDIAVLKVESLPASASPAAIAGEPVEQGEMVFAFGSPFQFDFSMSQGIVSAKGRQLYLAGYENYIQTDAAINPGNSGGPLTNIYGEVAGMNTAIATRNYVYNGIGFAIPVAEVTNVADQLIKTGAVERGYLGVYIGDLDPQMAESFGYDGRGVLVNSPIPGSPGADAGLKAGDIIVNVNDEEVHTADRLRYLIAGMQPGTKAKLRIFRDGEFENLTLTLGKLPDQMASGRGVAPGRSARPDSEQEQVELVDLLLKFGVTEAQTFTQEVAEQLGVPFERGVMITAIRRGSLAEQQGVTRGTLITGVQGEAVGNVKELSDALKQFDEGAPVRLQIMRQDPQTQQWLQRFVLIDIAE